MKFSIKDFFSKCDQIRRKLRIWLHLLKKSLMENFSFCAAKIGLFLKILLIAESRWLFLKNAPFLMSVWLGFEYPWLYLLLLFLRILLHSPPLIYTKYKFSTIRCRKSATNMVAKSWRNPCKSFFKTARYHQLYLFHSFRKRKATEQNCWTVSFN